MQSGYDSLWESFPHTLKTREGAGRYINAFRAPFQELPSLSPQQIYTLRACSLLVIPPPVGRTVPQGGFPTDLSELNLSGWTALVQDVVAGLQALPPRLSHDLGLQVVTLLQLLEVATGVGFCLHCCHPRPRCRCMGASQSAPSHVVESDCRADSRVWSDLLLQRSNHTEYLHGRYAWICGTSSRPHPSRLLHLEHASSGGLSAQGTTRIPIIPPSHWEGHTDESRSGQAGSTAKGSSVTDTATPGSSTAGSCSSDGATPPPATSLIQRSASDPLQAGSTTAT